MRSWLAASLGFSIIATSVFAATPSQAAPNDFFVKVWERRIGGTAFGQSSPLIEDLNMDGNPDVVAGAHNGTLYAFNGVDGSPLWDGLSLSGKSGIDSSPSAADVDGDGLPEVFVGSGYAESGSGPGALLSFENDGRKRFTFVADDGLAPSRYPGVHSSPALGDVDGDGQADVTFGTLGIKSIWSIGANAEGKAGFPLYTDDTNFSTPALVDLNGDGVTDFVSGQDQTPGTRCGSVRGVDGSGRQLFEKWTSEIVRSSPAVGDVNGDGRPEIVVGTGNNWSNPANATRNSASVCPGGPDSTKIFVMSADSSGSTRLTIDTGGNTFPSPALADFNGDGRLDIILGTSTQTRPSGQGGELLVYDGASGALLHRGFAGAGREDIIAGVSAADFDGDRRQDVAISTGSGTYLRQGGTGTLLGQVNVGQISSGATPAISDMDRDGRLDMITAGFTPGGQTAVIQRWEARSAIGSVTSASWPTFHHDNRRTGNSVPPPLTTPQPDYCVTSDNQGYWMTAGDGGVFPFCSAPFFGSAGGIRLNQPIVTMASTPTGKGYWLVASDGGVFPFGDAKFLGSTGAIRLNQPIIAMIPTASGNGYMLIARDGGVFPFGDAVFRGSTGAIRLNQPIVSAGTTPGNKGYWLVAADGGVFPFGDAPFLGSTGAIRLNQPITTMLATGGRGYSLIAADGGVFPFGDAPFLGSTGGIRLNRPIVAASFTASGRGYWMFASDGGVFPFGDAVFKGSLGRIRLNAPVVSAARP